jgi:hypothetical protein
MKTNEARSIASVEYLKQYEGVYKAEPSSPEYCKDLIDLKVSVDKNDVVFTMAPQVDNFITKVVDVDRGPRTNQEDDDIVMNSEVKSELNGDTLRVLKKECIGGFDCASYADKDYSTSFKATFSKTSLALSGVLNESKSVDGKKIFVYESAVGFESHGGKTVNCVFNLSK